MSSTQVDAAPSIAATRQSPLGCHQQSRCNEPLSSTGTPFTTGSSSIISGADVRQSLIAERPVLAGSGSKLEAFLITETHFLRQTPNFLGAGINPQEIIDLVEQCAQSPILFLVDNIAKDGGEALLHRLRQEHHPPLTIHVSTSRCWTSRQQLEDFPAEALLSAESVGTGRFNAALAMVLGGGRYIDAVMIQHAELPSKATTKLSNRELEVTLGVARGLRSLWTNEV